MTRRHGAIAMMDGVDNLTDPLRPCLTAVLDATQVVKIDAKVIDEHGTDLTKHLISSDIPGMLTRLFPFYRLTTRTQRTLAT